ARPPPIQQCPHPGATCWSLVGPCVPSPGEGDAGGAGVLQSFREELESLIQEQMKKGNNSSHIWALRQIADFMATTSPAVLPTSPMGLVAVTPINDLHGPEVPALAKGERLGEGTILVLRNHGVLALGDTAEEAFYSIFHLQAACEIQRQKPLGPTCKILVLRNHGVLALGDTAEEALYSIFHLQAACEIQVSALASAGGVENLIVLERAKHRPHEVGSVRWAGSTFGPMQKSRLGEHEFEALMRMLDNLGYRTGYTYRYPFVQEKSKPKSDVLIPATVTAFVFREEADPWLKADEVEKGSSGTPIRIENPNQFVPLYTDPQEVLEMRNKIREQNRQDCPGGGFQSRESHLGDAEAKETSREEAPPEPEPPNPFSQLTDQELEEYKQEVERKKLGLQGPSVLRLQGPNPAPAQVKPASGGRFKPPTVPGTAAPSLTSPLSPCQGEKKADGGQAPADSTAEKEPPAVVNGKDEEQSTEESLGKGGGRTTSPANADTDAPKEKETVTSSPVSPAGSPSKSPSKKKKKFRTPSFLKKGKKKEKIES
ncbi:beta-adducin, partial [Egretta garzetta]|uniref:beta-adducin n=1 Tax=Egretta garzetta TaxID=188379 RepID=UPI00163C2084